MTKPKPKRWNEARELISEVTEKFDELNPANTAELLKISDKHVKFLMAHNMWECATRDGIEGLGEDKAKFMHFAMN